MSQQFQFHETIADSRRRFIRTQSIKGGLGISLSLAYVALVGGPGLIEAAAFLGLVAPIGLALLALVPLPLERLEWVSVALFAALLALMSVLTGGLASPFLIWLALVPFEAALIGHRGAVVFAGLAAVAALAVVAAMHGLSELPPSRLPVSQVLLLNVSLLIAIVQASLMAVAAQERHLAADAAAEAGAARYRFLAENALDLITHHSADGHIRFASPSSQSLLGYPPGELAGLTLAQLTHVDDRQVIEDAFAEARAGRPSSAELRLETRNGSYVWSELRCRPVGPDNKPVSDIVAVTRDITRIKAHERDLIHARDQAEGASRAKSRFLANMSHELRTPLNAIIGFSDLMAHEMFGPLGAPRYVEYTRLIGDSGGHLLRLINSILDMSKIEAGRFTISPSRFDLEDLVKQAVQLLALQADRGEVVIARAIQPDAQRIFADKHAVMQILINLLSNGVKFTPKGGRVSVTAAIGSGGLELAVSDTGVGIDEADVQRLGQPFEQVENELTRTKEGTGLGLALVRALAHLHGGAMTVESALGEGTTVRVVIPQPAEGVARNDTAAVA